LAGVGAIDLTDGTRLSLSNTPAHSTGAWGYQMASLSSQAGAFVNNGTTHKLSLQPPITFMWAGTKLADGDDGAVWYGGGWDDIDQFPYVTWQILNGGPGETYFAFNDGSYQSIGPATISLGPHVVVCRLTTTAFDVFVDGLRVLTMAGASTILYSGTSSFGIGYYRAAARTTNTACSIGAVWKRELAGGEINQLTADPFCYLRR
jgi:hypothetical protein